MASILLSDFVSLTETDPTFPVCERGRSTWTRSEIAGLVHALDTELPASSRALPAGSLIAIQCPNGPMFLAALLLLRQRGWVALLVDTAAPATEIQRLASRFSCQGSLVIRNAWPTKSSCMTAHQSSCAAGSSPRLSDGLSETWSWSELEPLGEPLDPGVAVIKLTSGSTGEPRGVVVPEAALLADESALFRSMGLSTERTLTTIPLSHSYGLASIGISALRRNMTIVVPETPHPVSILRTLKGGDITFFPSVPAWLEAMARLSDGQPESLGSTRLVISAGAPLSASTAQRFLERYGKPIQPFYGASESGGITFDRTGQAGLRGELGTAVHGVEIELRALDRKASKSSAGQSNAGEDNTAENDTLQGGTLEGDTVESDLMQASETSLEPSLDNGTIVVRSPAIAAGYLEPGPKHQVLTNSRTLQAGRFRTSDLGQIESGVLRILGRQDDIINLKGKKVHPSEIERVLNAMPGIEAAYVFSECPVDRPESPILKALVASALPLQRQDIQTWCRGQLADHRIPRTVTVVKQLPIDQRGKLNRARARAMCSHRSTAR